MLAVNFEDLTIKVKDTLHTNSKPPHRLRLAKGFIPMMPGDYLLTLFCSRIIVRAIKQIADFADYLITY